MQRTLILNFTAMIGRIGKTDFMKTDFMKTDFMKTDFMKTDFMKTDFMKTDFMKTGVKIQLIKYIFY
jgi:pentapeptide MXKDX repeat protein